MRYREKKLISLVRRGIFILLLSGRRRRAPVLMRARGTNASISSMFVIPLLFILYPMRLDVVYSYWNLRNLTKLTEMPQNQVLVNVLKTPEHLQYQLAFISSVCCPNGLRNNRSNRHRNSVKYLPARRQTLRIHLRPTTASERRLREIAPSVSWGSSPKQMKSSGVELHVGTTSIKPALSSGRQVRGPVERKSNAYIGAIPLSFFSTRTWDMRLLTYFSCFY